MIHQFRTKKFKKILKNLIFKHESGTHRAISEQSYP